MLTRKGKRTGKRGQAAFNTLTSVMIGIVTVSLVFTILFLISAQTKTQIGTIDCAADPNGIGHTQYNATAQKCQNVTFGAGDNTTSDISAGYNATLTTIDAAAEVPDWIPLVVIAIVGGILLGIVAMFRGRG